MADDRQKAEDAAFLRNFSEGTTVNAVEVRRLHAIAETIAPAPINDSKASLLEVENKALKEENTNLRGQVERAQQAAAQAEKDAATVRSGGAGSPAPFGTESHTPKPAEPVIAGGAAVSKPSAGTEARVPTEPKGGALDISDTVKPPGGQGVPASSPR